MSTTESPPRERLEAGESLRGHLKKRHRMMRRMGIEPSPASLIAVAQLDKTTNPRPQGARAPRAAGTRRRGSRRTTSTRGSPDDDPDDPEPHRVCAGCGEELTDKAPQARYHGDACRKRAERARKKAARPRRPIWPSAGIEPTPLLAVLMQDPPHGVATEAVAA